MKAGVIGTVDGDFDAVRSYTETVTEGDTDLKRCLDVNRVFSLPSGRTAFAGRAVAEYMSERIDARIDGGAVSIEHRPEKAVRVTEFVGVPGEFVVVGSKRGRFAYDLIAADTDTSIERTTISLDGFFEDHPSSRPWKAGFYGNGSGAGTGTGNGDGSGAGNETGSVDDNGAGNGTGSVDDNGAGNGTGDGDGGVTGVFHGTDLRSNHDLSGILEHSSLNQIGLEYEYGGRPVKMTASESGYVQVYAPADFDSGDYLDYLVDEIAPYVG